jgi:hypothetical protein
MSARPAVAPPDTNASTCVSAVTLPWPEAEQARLVASRAGHDAGRGGEGGRDSGRADGHDRRAARERGLNRDVHRLDVRAGGDDADLDARRGALAEGDARRML